MKNKEVKGILALVVVTALSFGVIIGSKSLALSAGGDASGESSETLEEFDVSGAENIEKAGKTADGYLVTVRTKGYVGDRMKICTVIGFPNGYNTTAVKEFETRDAIENGADEIDMVINIGWVKDGRYDLVEEEIRCLKAACGDKILKVIIETCLLTDTEKIRMCEVVTAAKADFIKTSTGFSKAGATFDDIALFASHVGENVQIKAAGGISSFADADEFVKLGADRLGTSRLVKIEKQQ